MTFRLCSAQVPRRGMREGFQSPRQSRAAHARTQGSSPDPHARRCLNSSCPQTKTRHQIFPFCLHAPTTPYCSNHAVFLFVSFFFEIFFITLPLSSLASFFSSFVVYSTWAQVSAGTLQPSTTGQGQFFVDCCCTRPSL